MGDSKITTYKDLKAWEKGHQLVLRVYDITKDFPKEEMFGLVSQMRRCAVSITSNIAEGFSRKSFKEKVQFYYQSLGSLTELDNQLLISKDIKYISEVNFADTIQLLSEVQMILNGLIKKSKESILNS